MHLERLFVYLWICFTFGIWPAGKISAYHHKQQFGCACKCAELLLGFG